MKFRVEEFLFLGINFISHFSPAGSKQIIITPLKLQLLWDSTRSRKHLWDWEWTELCHSNQTNNRFRTERLENSFMERIKIKFSSIFRKMNVTLKMRWRLKREGIVFFPVQGWGFWKGNEFWLVLERHLKFPIVVFNRKSFKRTFALQSDHLASSFEDVP